jgi:hypothetical protein
MNQKAYINRIQEFVYFDDRGVSRLNATFFALCFNDARDVVEEKEFTVVVDWNDSPGAITNKLRQAVADAIGVSPSDVMGGVL